MSFLYRDTTGSSKFQLVTWTWAGANPSEATKDLYGYVLHALTNPGSAPDDNYDLTITDADGVDVLLGAGADRDLTNSERIFPRDNGVPVPVPFSGPLTFVLANQTVAGAAGTVQLYIAVPR